jgi:hypothetical protein
MGSAERTGGTNCKQAGLLCAACRYRKLCAVPCGTSASLRLPSSLRSPEPRTQASERFDRLPIVRHSTSLFIAVLAPLSTSPSRQLNSLPTKNANCIFWNANCIFWTFRSRGMGQYFKSNARKRVVSDVPRAVNLAASSRPVGLQNTNPLWLWSSQ